MMGYQEFILPKFNAKNRNNDVTILTSNAYYPVQIIIVPGNDPKEQNFKPKTKI